MAKVRPSAQNTVACSILATRLRTTASIAAATFSTWQCRPLALDLEPIREKRGAPSISLIRPFTPTISRGACAVTYRLGSRSLAAGRLRPAAELRRHRRWSLHAEKYYRTVAEEFNAARKAFRWRHRRPVARNRQRIWPAGARSQRRERAARDRLTHTLGQRLRERLIAGCGRGAEARVDESIQAARWNRNRDVRRQAMRHNINGRSTRSLQNTAARYVGAGRTGAGSGPCHRKAHASSEVVHAPASGNGRCSDGNRFSQRCLSLPGSRR